jgi:hypothetical protein
MISVLAYRMFQLIEVIVPRRDFTTLGTHLASNIAVVEVSAHFETLPRSFTSIDYGRS